MGTKLLNQMAGNRESTLQEIIERAGTKEEDRELAWRRTVRILLDERGMTEEDLHSIVVTHIQPDNPNKTHVGLHNSYKRFRLLFGNDLTFSINSKEGVGTSIDIKLYK